MTKIMSLLRIVKTVASITMNIARTITHHRRCLLKLLAIIIRNRKIRVHLMLHANPKAPILSIHHPHHHISYHISLLKKKRWFLKSSTSRESDSYNSNLKKSRLNFSDYQLSSKSIRYNVKTFIQLFKIGLKNSLRVISWWRCNNYKKCTRSSNTR